MRETKGRCSHLPSATLCAVVHRKLTCSITSWRNPLNQFLCFPSEATRSAVSHQLKVLGCVQVEPNCRSDLPRCRVIYSGSAPSLYFLASEEDGMTIACPVDALVAKKLSQNSMLANLFKALLISVTVPCSCGKRDGFKSLSLSCVWFTQSLSLTFIMSDLRVFCIQDRRAVGRIHSYL